MLKNHPKLVGMIGKSQLQMTEQIHPVARAVKE
jgi:hypothetical protein